MGKQFLGREAIFAAADVPEEDVHVPEWGGWVKVRGLSGKQRDEFEKSVMIGKGRDRTLNLSNMRAKLVSRTVVDEAGGLLFGEADVPALGNKSAVALQRIVEVALRLSGLTEEDEEELLKNSESGQPDASPSA